MSVTPEAAPPKIDALLNNFTETQQGASSDDKRTIEAKMADQEIQNQQSFNDLRQEWSPYLKWILGATTLFQATFIILIGCGLLPFKDHEIFLNTISSELFLQIAGLGYIVVRCLYPDGKNTSTKQKKKSPTPKS